MYSWRKCFRMLRLAILVCALFFMAMDALSSKNFTPPNQGDLTVAEFAENYNHQAAQLDAAGWGTLDEEGQWPQTEYFNLRYQKHRGAVPEQWRDVSVTLETDDDRVTGATFRGYLVYTSIWDFGNGSTFKPKITPVTRALVGALAWAQEDAPRSNLMRQAYLGTLNLRNLNNYESSIAGVEIISQVVHPDKESGYDVVFTVRLAD